LRKWQAGIGPHSSTRNVIRPFPLKQGKFGRPQPSSALSCSLARDQLRRLCPPVQSTMGAVLQLASAEDLRCQLRSNCRSGRSYTPSPARNSDCAANDGRTRPAPAIFGTRDAPRCHGFQATVWRVVSTSGLRVADITVSEASRRSVRALRRKE